MKIIFFGSAMEQNDFSSFKKLWGPTLNPSGQNFHNKFIRCLSAKHEVIAASFNPFSKSIKHYFKEKQDGSIRWMYFPRNKRFVLLSRKEQKQICSKKDKHIVLVDTMNLVAVINAKRFAKKTEAKIIGIVTDNPANITGQKNISTKLLLRSCKNLDGYICLTSGLNDVYNTKNKPSIIIYGIGEPTVSEEPNMYGKYIFFGGALLQQYGIYELIEGFNRANLPDIKLIICGHHKETKLDQIIAANSNISFLGNLDINEVKILEANAQMCVNPRPINDALDLQSFPSKVLEYLSSGSPTISTKHKDVYELFKNEIYWLNDLSPDSFACAFKKCLDDKPINKIKRINSVEQIVGFDTINSKLEKFFQLF